MRSSAAMSSGPSRSQRAAAAQLARSCSARVAPNSTLATSGLVKGNASASAAAVVCSGFGQAGQLAGCRDGRGVPGLGKRSSQPARRGAGPVLAGQHAARQAERGDDPGTCPRDRLLHGGVLDPGPLDQAVGKLDRAGRCDREARGRLDRLAAQIGRPVDQAPRAGLPAATSAPTPATRSATSRPAGGGLA